MRRAASWTGCPGARGSTRHVASVGEPLNAEAVVWGREVLGRPIHDNWWQTETGSIMIANFPVMDIKPGSMGRPVPGVEAAIVRRTAGGGVEVVEEAATAGELALRGAPRSRVSLSSSLTPRRA